MLRDQRQAWLTRGIVAVILLLNVIIIRTGYVDNQNLFWMLIVSIPLLFITIYNAWQTNHLYQNNFADSLKPSTPQSHLEWSSHSLYPNKITPTDLIVRIGNDQCSQPYTACIFNVGSKEDTGLESTFIHATKEKELEYSEYSLCEGLTTYHMAAGGLVWQIGSDYLGCRTENGHFNSNEFKKTAHRPEVKMIELKLSAIKPIYPVDSLLGFTEPIERKKDDSIFSGSAYTTFRDAEGMIHFLNNLRELSGGKPIGIRLCIHDKKEFYQICHAVGKTQLFPDFIVVEGPFEKTSIVLSDKAIHTGMPFYDALLFVSQTLQMYGLQNKIKLIADGNIISCFDILKVLALGANVVCTEMPRYTTIKYPGDSRKLSLRYKCQSAYVFHDNLMKDTVQIMNVCGFKNVSDITLSKFFSRLDIFHSKNIENLNAAVSHPGARKKFYNSKINSYQ